MFRKPHLEDGGGGRVGGGGGANDKRRIHSKYAEWEIQELRKGVEEGREKAQPTKRKIWRSNRNNRNRTRHENFIRRTKHRIGRNKNGAYNPCAPTERERKNGGE